MELESGREFKKGYTHKTTQNHTTPPPTLEHGGEVREVVRRKY
jgi:hypothetical protein